METLNEAFNGKHTRLTVICLLSSIALPIPHAIALEGGNSAYLKGSRDFLTGVVPKEPGVYFRDDVVFYNGSIKQTVLSGKVQARLDADLLVNLIRPTIVTPWEVFGGTYAFGFTWPQIDASINGQLTRSNGKIEGEENLTDFGDVIATPILVGWHQGNLHINTSLSVWVPTGSYEHGRVLNTGKNYWSVSPQIGVTYLEPQTGWDFSATGIYLVNFENSATDYKSGDVLHLDLAVGKK
nr:transporter [Pseudomonas fluorescens]